MTQLPQTALAVKAKGATIPRSLEFQRYPGLEQARALCAAISLSPDIEWAALHGAAIDADDKVIYRFGQPTEDRFGDFYVSEGAAA